MINQKEKTLIFVGEKTFKINTDGWQLFLALRLLMKTIKDKQPEYYKNIVKHLKKDDLI